MATATRPNSQTSPARHRTGMPEELRLDAPQGQARRPKLSWIALGLAVVLAGGLFGAVTLARVADRTPVLALAEAIERGEMVTAEHLRVVEVAVDEPLPLVAAEERTALVGLTATSALPAGSLLMHEHLADGPRLEAGWSVVGLELRPGEYPTRALAPGDAVEVVRTPDSTTARGEGAAGVSVLTDAAEVFAVESLSETSPTLMVSLTVPREVAPAIAAAAAEGRVRLVLVPAP